MRVPLSAAVTLGLLFFLSVGLNEQVAEGCRCIQRSPQQKYCNSDTVIRANITGQVKSTNSGTTYGIKLIKTFKQTDNKPVQFIHSPQTSCGITLKNGEYLLGVIQAKITGQVKETKLKSYSFEIIKTFKYVDTNPVQFIVSSPGTCGINLQNEEYLLGDLILYWSVPVDQPFISAEVCPFVFYNA
ncbi:metallo ase inhibitor 3-like protein [Labeo rohita]|uniref:Metallo ase inhibitor 3-like protein n=1 Tax=Labeo rohita TaxID=84645 RepID=A0A498NJ65_LABRO|nr:metallo ase inhibitor 3-like protein [Labeo rohita]